MPHFFGHAVDGRVEIGGEDAAHLARSLRARPGEVISVVDPGDGAEGLLLTVKLTAVSPAGVSGDVVESTAHCPEPRRRVTLAIAMLPAPALELALRYGTELGAVAFVLVQAERSVARGARPDRWATICRESAMLAGRLVVPPVTGPVSLREAIRDASAPLVLDRAADVHLAGVGGEALEVFVGPEGGFSPSELALFSRRATLGPRNLRAETAAAAAIAIAAR